MTLDHAFAYNTGFADGYAMRDHAAEGADQWTEWHSFNQPERAEYTKGYNNGIRERNGADKIRLASRR